MGSLDKFFDFVLWILTPLAILGVWKLIELIIIVFNHIKIV